MIFRNIALFAFVILCCPVFHSVSDADPGNDEIWEPAVVEQVFERSFNWSTEMVSPEKFWGLPLSPREAVDQALQWMQGHPIMGESVGTIRSLAIWPNVDDDYFLYVIELLPQGYLVLNSAESLPLVVGFSPSASVSLADREDNVFLAMLRQHINRVIRNFQERQEKGEVEVFAPKQVLAHHASRGVEQHGPWLETSWNQCHPYNLYCPDVDGGSQYYGFRAPTGCVPTAFAQVLHYHRWPYYGKGSHYYVDSQGNTTGEHEADFPSPYDWSNMQTGYSAYGNHPEDAAQAVARLMYDLGVAAEANYESGSTSSSTSTLGTRLNEYFYFEPTLYQNSQEALLAALASDLRTGFPSVISIPGHAVVADGLLVVDGQTNYHINYGWGGTNNGWYAADNIQGSSISSGVTSIQPLLMPFPKSETLTGQADVPIKFEWFLPQRREDEVDRLLIQRLAAQGVPWQSDASSLDGAMANNWSVVPEGRTGYCWYAGPNGHASLTLRDLWIPTSDTKLEFWMQYRLSSAAFTVEISTDNGETFTEIFRRSDNYDLNWQEYSVSLGDFTGQQAQVRFMLYQGSFYSSGGVWVDDLSLTGGQWLRWEFFAEDTELAAYRFSAETDLWDDATDFSQFEKTSNSDYKDWVVSENGEGGFCFFKEGGGYGSREYHLTSRNTINPDFNTRLLFRWKRHLASDRLRVLVSTNKADFVEIWSVGGSIGWADEAASLSDFAGQDIYVRLEYVVGTYYSSGGVWIDSLSLQKVQYPEREKQPLHYTYLDDLPAGSYTLSAALVDHDNIIHSQAPAFHLEVASGAQTYNVLFDPKEHGLRVGGGALRQTVRHGDAATAPEIEAQAGWTFTGWDVDCNNITADLQVNALYERNWYNFSFLAGDHGILEQDEHEFVVEVVHGSPPPDQPLVFAHEGWLFAGWFPSLPEIVTDNFFTMAQFSRLTYNLLYDAVGNGSIVGISPQSVEHGENGEEVTAVPDAGHRFVQWSDGVETRARTDTNIVDDLNVAAEFEPKWVPAIAWPAPAAVVYGTALSDTQLNAETDTDGAFAYDPPAGTVLSAGPHTLRATFTSADGVNWAATEGTVELTVEKAPLTITAADLSKTYGQAVVFVGDEFTVDGLVGENTVTAVTLASDGAAACAPVAKTPYAIVPSAAVGAGLDNYVIEYVNGALAVARAALTVTADSTTRRVGQPNPAFSCTPTGLACADTLDSIGLEVVYDCPADEASVPADYPITPSGPATTDNYDVAYVAGTLTVTAKDVPTITWPAPAAIVYGTALDGTQLNAEADTAGKFFYDPPAGTVLSAGPHTLQATFTPADGVNWAATAATVPLTVKQAPLTVTADDCGKTYGEADPALTYTSTGAVAGETPAFTGPLARVPGETVGNYAIGQGDLALADNDAFKAANYALEFAGGVTFAISAKDASTLTVADVGPFVYTGGAHTPEPEILDGTTVLVKDTDYALSYAANTDAGTATLTVAGIGNYAGTQDKTFATGKATVTVTPEAGQGKVFGAPDPAFTYTNTGAVAGETPAFTGTLARGAGKTVGNYAIGQGNLALADNGAFKAANYSLVFTAGATFAISAKDAAPLTVAVVGPFTYTGGAHTPEPDVLDGATGLVKDTDYTLSYAANTDAGTATLTVTGLGNYAGMQARTFDIKRATLMATAGNATRLYGDPNPESAVMLAGFVDGEDDGVLDALPTATCTADATSPAGDYAIVPAGGAAANYAFAYVDGTLSVLDGGRFKLWAAAGDGAPTALELGEAKILADGLGTLDVPALPGAVARLMKGLGAAPAMQAMARDFRPIPAGQLTRWRLEVSDAQTRGTVTLTWDVEAAADGREVWLQKLADERPVGLPVDMKTQNSLPNVAAGTVFEIVYGVPETFEIPLRRGWNAVGTPLLGLQTLGQLAVRRGDGEIGFPAWRWNGDGFEPVGAEAPFLPETGYLLRCVAESATLSVTGLPPDGVLPLGPGWNLLSPVAAMAPPVVRSGGTATWQWNGGSQSHRPTDAFEPGKAYWWHGGGGTAGDEPAAGKVLQSTRGRELAPDAGDLDALVAGNTAFAIDLYHQWRGADGNLFLSPHSISIALGMTYAGARGETATQMSTALRFGLPDDRLHAAFNALDLELAARGEGAAGMDGQPFRLRVVNQLWGERTDSFLAPFLDTLAEHYGAGLRAMDFVGAAEPARLAINDWVAYQTEQRIRDLLPQGSVNNLTRLVLTNAVYFNATWESPFPPANSGPGGFVTLAGGAVQVPMMRQTANFPAQVGASWTAVELPYDGGELSMLLLVPDAGTFADFERELTAARLAAILAGLSPHQVTLAMPSFEYAGKASLRTMLSQLGMPVAFAEGADFSGMDGTRDLLISDVFHQAFVKVNEAGTEAAAATGVVVGVTSVPPALELAVDRPFLFLIRDRATGAILFLGRVLDPR